MVQKVCFFHGNDDYSQTIVVNCVFVKKFSNSDFITFLLYVDDMSTVGHDTKKIQILNKYLNKSFATKNLGLAQQILGIRISLKKRNVNCAYLNIITLRRC